LPRAHPSLFLIGIYQELLAHYGRQGWWPLLRLQQGAPNPTGRGQYTGYHPSDYVSPTSEGEILEVMVGAILTQNTSWVNAEKGVHDLHTGGFINISEILTIDQDLLAEIIRSSGYFNQKAIKLKNLCRFLSENPISALQEKSLSEVRAMLLGVNGIGPETADSMLLYALKKPIFVVDAYTKRLFSRLGLVRMKPGYDELQLLFRSEISPDLVIYNEYHALIVQHCVHVCKSKPDCDACFLTDRCPKKIAIRVPKKKPKTAGKGGKGSKADIKMPVKSIRDEKKK